MSSVITSYFNIFDYWKNKCVAHNGCIIESSNTEYNIHNSEEIVVDWDYPYCWAFGNPVSSAVSALDISRSKWYSLCREVKIA